MALASTVNAATHRAMHAGEQHGGGVGVLYFASADLLFKLSTMATKLVLSD